MSQRSSGSFAWGVLAAAALWVGGGFTVSAAAPEGGKYEAGEVKDGGSISGVVKWAGPAPAATPLQTTKDQETCGKESPNEEVIVGKDGGLKNAVVMLDNIKKGAPFEA